MVSTEIYSANRPCTENLIRYNMSIVVSVLDSCLFCLFVLLTICISILLPLCAVYGQFVLVFEKLYLNPEIAIIVLFKYFPMYYDTKIA